MHGADSPGLKKIDLRVNNGGHRTGSGRKPTGLRPKNLTANQVSEAKVRERLPELLEALMDAALGVKMATKEGNIYQRAPDVKAGEYLWNRVGGKPIERVEVDSEGTQTVRIVFGRR